MTDLSGKTALVTGASRGIGAAAARRLAEAGAAVVLCARSTGDIEKIAEEIRQSGGKALAVSCDVARYEDVAKAVETSVTEFGSIDILVNNAGLIDPISRLSEADIEGWDKVIDVNVKGVFYGLRSVLPHMEKAGTGTIINISSGAATSVLEGWSHYCASKAAVLSLTRCTDKEVGSKGIRVLGLSPGTVATEMQVAIKASGINPVSQLDPSVHIPADWVGQAIVWLSGPAGSDYVGTDCPLRDEGVRKAIGLI